MQFEVTFTDARFRDYKATFYRAARGSFPKLLKLERWDNNGKFWYWTLYRPSCHGNLEANTQALLKQQAQIVRMQA